MKNPRSTKGITVVGLDWATEEPRRGIAVATLDGEAVTDVQLLRCSRRVTATDTVVDIVRRSEGVPVLLAIDAPLGWPVPLAEALAEHRAGQGIAVSPSKMFSRDTDRHVRETIGKIPMEVGANLIARVAHSAVTFLADLRDRLSLPVRLAWCPDEVSRSRVSVIEVYPAATRTVVPVDELARSLPLLLNAGATHGEHVRDALWCVVAARDFVRGECDPPGDRQVAAREGWIWLRRSVGRSAVGGGPTS